VKLVIPPPQAEKNNPTIVIATRRKKRFIKYHSWRFNHILLLNQLSFV
jgi:hypothetical protein